MAELDKDTVDQTINASMSDPIDVFDGHNDVVTQIMQSGGLGVTDTFCKNSEWHIDKVKAKSGHLAGGIFAMWVPSPSDENYQALMTQAEYDVPLPPPVSQAQAIAVVSEQVSILRRLESMGEIRLCTSSAELTEAFAGEKLAMVLHLEGAEPIDPDLYFLDLLYAAGLRSLGLVWSRPNQFAEGVPFRFPASPDIGKGLTGHGVALVKRCNELGVLIDLAHINLAGFMDVSEISTQPLVATHSNVHALCPHARNLTDTQLGIIQQSGGLVGLNFATAFLREDGRMVSDVPVEQMLKHLDYLLEKLGETGVALGSDFDGAEVPDFIGSAAGLQRLVQAMRTHGYDERLIHKICYQNWFDMLRKTWGE